MDEITALENEKRDLEKLVSTSHDRIREIRIALLKLKWGIVLNETRVTYDKRNTYIVTSVGNESHYDPKPHLFGKRVLKSGAISENLTNLWTWWEVMKE